MADPAIRQYLDEINKFPLLTREQEIDLAKRIATGDKIAHKELVEGNLRLVVSIARSYSGSDALLDLIQEGNIGLSVAASKFRHDKGAKFSTYAAWWIKQHIRRALHKNARLIYVPVQVTRRTAQAKATKEALTQTLGREPTEEELQEELKLTTQQFSRVQAAWNKTVSLQEKAGDKDGDGPTIEETVPDEHAEDPQSNSEITAMREKALEFLLLLKPREQEILMHRFGLCNYTPKTLEQTSEHLGITRERVRQIQKKTMLKMKKWMAEERLITMAGSTLRLLSEPDDESDEEQQQEPDAVNS